MKRRLVLALVLVIIPALLLSCGQGADRQASRRVMVIGIDGLEWDVMAPLIENGELPTFSRIMREGAWGEVRSLEFLVSPVIWTSIATGKLPEKHGISNFVAPNEAGRSVPMTSNMWQVEPVWDILGSHGLSVGIIGWFVTWPATPVNGYLVSDHFYWGTAASGGQTRDLTYPPRLARDLDSLRVRPTEVPESMWGRFVEGDPTVSNRTAQRHGDLVALLSTDETLRRVSLHMATETPTDFFAVYFPGVDRPSHRYWVDRYPDSGPTVPAEEAEIFREVIPRYYRHMDSVLAELLDLADEETTVIVTSDHGHSGPKRDGEDYAFGIAMHDSTGFVCLWGKDIVPGQRLDRPSVLDVTPTVLALYGLPVAEDMDGRVLTEAIDPDFLSEYPVSTVPTYQTGGADGAEEPIESAVDEEIKERLRSLGYIE